LSNGGLISGAFSSGGSSTSTLTKVTKDYTDIVVGTASMPIYTLPASQALVNVFTDITTVFNVSDAVTIGDSSDPDGFQQTTDWTSSTGLTSATRGLYVSQFKGMRSVSGTTAISAYNFSTVASSTFTQSDDNEGFTIQDGGREEITQQMNAGQILVDEEISTVSFFLREETESTAGIIRAYIRSKPINGGGGGVIQEAENTLDASELDGTYAEKTFDFPSTTLSVDDMICINATDMTDGVAQVNCDNSGALTDGKMYNTTTPGSNYNEIAGNKMRFTVTYGTLVSDTQGAVDFYLQIAKE